MRSQRYRSVIRIRNALLLLAVVLAVGAAVVGWKAFSTMPAAPNTEQSDSPAESSENQSGDSSDETSEGSSSEPSVMMTLFVTLLALLAADLTAVIILTWYAGQITKAANKALDDSVRREQTVLESTLTPNAHNECQPSSFAAIKVGPAQYGKAHNIGSRPSQQDSLGQTEVAQGEGVLAVVADGMGGLSSGDQVSQAIVRAMLGYAASLQPGQMDGVLQEMVRRVNEGVNQMLGPDGLYKSGSTLVAVLAQGCAFHWLSVGDSRIYLYRNGRMIQLNQEHTLLQEWMPDILNGKLHYEDAMKNPDRAKLTSFIGMGQLKHVDASLRPVRISQGDRVLLMSDGVFNTLSESVMEQILSSYPDAQQAAKQFEKSILQAKMPGQDNFTVVILGF